MAAKKVDIWMPIYIGCYLGDTMHLTTEQHGAYFLLLVYGWKIGGRIPCDDESLQSITKISAEKWPNMRRALAGFFHESGGFWSQKRQLIELKAAAHRRKTSAENGKNGGRPTNPDRTQTEPENNPAGYRNETQTEPDGKAEANPEKSSVSSSSSLSPPKPPPLPASPQRVGVSAPPQRPVPDSAFDAFWKAYPRKSSKGHAEKAWAKVDPSLLPAILAAIKAQAAGEQWKKDGGQYIPHPATWLNGKRWEDETPGQGSGGDSWAAPYTPTEEEARRIFSEEA